MKKRYTAKNHSATNVDTDGDDRQRLLADATLNDGKQKVIDIHFMSEVWFFAGSFERIRGRDPLP
jgi:hypothetical protein